MVSFTEFYWHRYHDGIFPMNFDYIVPPFFIYKFIMPDHIKASIERLFQKIPAMKFPLISKSSFPNIYHFAVNAHCTHFLPGAPLTASSGALIFVPQTGFAEICFSIILSPANRKKGDISFGRTNLQLRRSSII